MRPYNSYAIWIEPTQLERLPFTPLLATDEKEQFSFERLNRRSSEKCFQKFGVDTQVESSRVEDIGAGRAEESEVLYLFCQTCT